MKWTEIPAGELHAAEQRVRVALGNEADSIVKKINTDPRFADLVANMIIALSQGNFKKQFTSLNPQWLHAREIMGKNFFGIEEAIKYFRIIPTFQQIVAFSKIPFSEEILQETKNTHILVAVFPLSIYEIRKKIDSKLFYHDIWYDGYSFDRECDEPGWQLILKIPVPGSISKPWKEQQALINENCQVPTAQVMVYSIIGHYLSSGESLFQEVDVNTTSMSDIEGYRVGVGRFDSRGLDIFYRWDGLSSKHTGISCARKLF